TNIDKEPDINELLTLTDFRLNTGDIPYPDYFGSGMIDQGSLCEITIKNGTSQDAAVILLNTETESCMRNIYIRANNSFTIKQIPEGIYKMKYFQGDYWNPKLNNGEGFPIGGFSKNISFSMPSSSKDYFIMYKEKTDNGYNYPTYTVTLHTVVNGNMKTKKISKDIFFE
ncbi:MAG: hypothetical protein LBQ65_04615, partial [Tannerellaceae bacterium]|nr:hypothetical protein [Tannerellaceae bacterium]